MAEVVTKTGMPVYGPAPLAQCQKYIEQALSKGSNPGFLSIVAGSFGSSTPRKVWDWRSW